MNNELKTNNSIGVVLCDCGGTLRDRLNFERLREYLAQLPAVRKVVPCSKFCQQSECIKAVASLFENKKNVKRLVIGACDHEIFDKTLRQTTEGSALNPGLIWSVNIREHCAWVASTQEAATDKSIELLTAAIRRVKLAEALKSKKVSLNQDVLVLGATVAAMQTAVALSQLGHRVILVESRQNLGGMVAETPELYAYVADNFYDAKVCVQSRVDELIAQVGTDKQVRLLTSSSLKSIKGEFGNFTAVVSCNGTEQIVSSGAIVWHQEPKAINSRLANLISHSAEIPRRIAIVMDQAEGLDKITPPSAGLGGEQDVGVCAQVLSAAELLSKRFGAEVKLYCRNIQVAATGLEGLHRRARQAGVVVVKYQVPPVISDEGSKKILRVEEPTIGCQLQEEFDIVIIADTTGLRPEFPPKGVLWRISNFEFRISNSVWLSPTKTNRKGVFVVGQAAGVSEFRDAQADALATANQIHELLRDEEIEILDDAAVVDDEKCALCLTCLRICPHCAVSIDVANAVASISSVSCQRCGICAAQCPANAIQLPRFSDQQIAAELGWQPQAELSAGTKPKITVFACENSAYRAATLAARLWRNGSTWEPAVQLIRVPCAGKVDCRDVLRALERGAKKVIILACHLESCQYLTGATAAARRVERLNRELEEAGVPGKQVVFGQLASVEPSKFLEYVS